MQIRIAPLYEKESGAHGEERKKKLLSLFLCLVILWCFVSSSLQSDPPFPPFKQPWPGCWERERENRSRSFSTNFHVWPKTGHKFIQIPLEFTPDLLFKKMTPVRQTLNVFFFCTINHVLYNLSWQMETGTFEAHQKGIKWISSDAGPACRAQRDQNETIFLFLGWLNIASNLPELYFVSLVSSSVDLSDLVHRFMNFAQTSAR